MTPLATRSTIVSVTNQNFTVRNIAIQPLNTPSKEGMKLIAKARIPKAIRASDNETLNTLTKLLAKNFSFVVGTDINFIVLKNQTYSTKNLVCCNGSDALKSEFDLVVCNLPYLATDQVLDATTDGGIDGFEIPKKIFDSIYKNVKVGGKFLFVTSSLSNYQKLMDYAQKLGLSPKILAKKKLFFEELILVEAIKNK